MTLFEHLNALCLNKEDIPEHELKSYDPYMISRCVSMTEIYLPFVAEMNKHNLPKQQHARILKSFLPD